MKKMGRTANLSRMPKENQHKPSRKMPNMRKGAMPRLHKSCRLNL